ncbi:DUF7255 family protein [Nafulsella turpanensis]|uniref:DUF7255 family protein n=1 Tax=Nafulsella turpanensis TaxID=1265690 RepID=UPI00034D0E89|nr:hypothetical protein [Nafulsella turpanensis]
MQQSLLQFLADQLNEQGLPVYITRPGSFRSSQFKHGKEASLVEEVYQELLGKGNCWNIAVSLPEGLETEKVRLTIDGPLHFNRYRATTFQSAVYASNPSKWLEPYRRYCRTAEAECLKDGRRQGIWTNKEAALHFGPSQEAGDLYGTGSAGWRLRAFQDFLNDFYLFRATSLHQRVAVYDRLMVQGRLIPLQQLLQSRSESSKPYLVKFLARQLGMPLEQPKDPFGPGSQEKE